MPPGNVSSCTCPEESSVTTPVAQWSGRVVPVDVYPAICSFIMPHFISGGAGTREPPY